jgi:hypothetical protein
LDLLEKFKFRGIIAIHLKELRMDKRLRPRHKATIIINIKAKEKYMNDFLEHTELEHLVTDKWAQHPGFYIRINKQIIPTLTL